MKGQKKDNSELKLTLQQKKIVESVFEPLLRDTFGDDKYKKYSVKQAKQIVRKHVYAFLKEKPIPGLVGPAMSTIFKALNDVRKAKSLVEILTIISEMCLLEENLEE
jgi:hypothetical protein